MHNSAEKSVIMKVITAVISLIAIALLVFIIKYSRESLYPTNADGYYKVDYINLDENYSSTLIAADEDISLPQLTRVGYTFSGWYYDVNGVLKVQTGETVMSDLKLYAIWDVNGYTVTVHPNYNELTAYNVNINYQDAFNVNPPVRTGYSFVNWFFDEDCTEAVELNTMPAEDLIIYAKWAINSYNLRLFSGAGLPSIPDTLVVYNSALSLPILQKDGYTFTGWYRESALQNEVIGASMPANNLILYAGWMANVYQIHFITNGGSTLEPINSVFEADISQLQIPQTIRPGYNFEFWYDDFYDDSAEYVFSTMPIGGITIYAKWSVRTDIEYKIEYYFEDDQGNFVRNDDETEVLYGITDEYRAISYKTYFGYDFDAYHILNYTEGYIMGDGSTVFKFYYRIT